MSRNLIFCAAVSFLAHSSPAAGAKPVASASGGGTIGGDAPTHVSFHITRNSDDTASGHANVILFFFDGTFHITADLDCLAIINATTAIVSGVIVKSTLPQSNFEPGDGLVFAVQDNGEGKNAVDLLSPISGIDNPLPNQCFETQVTQFEALQGNVHVRRGPVDE
jgi:hypothetical protein